MNSTNTTGFVAHVPAQIPGQPPTPANSQPGNPPSAPLLRNVTPAEDPRGTKRYQEAADIHDKESSSKQVHKRARTEPAVEVEYPNQQELFDAIKDNKITTLKNLLKDYRGKIDAQSDTSSGLTLLCLAAYLNNAEIIKLLIDRGAKQNVCARNGSTPLMFAAQGGCREAIKLLITRKSDLNVVNNSRYAINPKMVPFTALDFAINAKKVEACKILIELGADLKQFIQFGDQDNQKSRTPLLLAIESNLTELLDWLIRRNSIALNSVEPSTKLTLINAAASQGSLQMIDFFMGKGADLNEPYIDKDGQQRSGGVWRIACSWKKSYVIESLLARGMHPPSLANWNSFIQQIGCNLSTDLILHRSLLAGHDNAEPDGLTDVSLRRQPEKILELMTQKGPLLKNTADCVLNARYLSKGLSASLLALVRGKCTHELQSVFSRLSGRPFDNLSSNYRKISTYAQQLQVLIEQVSEICGDPKFPVLFAGEGLTPQGETVMTRMLILQRNLILEGIARLREQFDRQVARLPELCMTTYISRTHRLNEVDLYRVLTEDFGLYDPIARAVLRLVTVAYDRFRHATSQPLPAKFGELSPEEQLKVMIIDVLKEWDKIPEIVTAFRESQPGEEMDITIDLLFQQWRLFNEAFGVTKERPLGFGPVRRNEVGVDQLTANDLS